MWMCINGLRMGMLLPVFGTCASRDGKLLSLLDLVFNENHLLLVSTQP